MKSASSESSAPPALRFQVQVEGMTCTTCALSVRKYLESLGLEDVHVDYISGEVIFRSGTPPDFDQLAKGLAALGYRVVEQGEEGRLYRRLQRMLLISAVLTAPLLLPMFGVGGWVADPWVQGALATVVYAIGLAAFGRGAWQSARSGTPNMDVLILLGATAAYIYSIVGLWLGRPDMIFFETTASIITLVLLGHWIEVRSVRKTGEALERLAGRQIKAAKVLVGGKVETRDIDLLQAGDIVVVATGDTVPVDGIVVGGEATLDESMLTGEAVPRRRRPGDRVFAGTVVTHGSLEIRTERTGKETVLGEIVRILKQARTRKAQVQRLADKISAVFVPVVVTIAILTVGLNWWVFDVPFAQSLLRGVAVLVISCPCALGLATPTAVTVGIGKAALRGIIIKGGAVIEQIPKIRVLFFDKTGTLTTGKFKEVRLELCPGHSYSEEVLAGVLYALERHSSHPLAQGIVGGLAQRITDPPALADVVEEKGQGVRGRWEGREVMVGRIPPDMTAPPDVVAALYIEGKCVALVKLTDELRPDAQAVIDYFKSRGIRPVILSGDRPERVAAVAQALGIDEWHAGMRPDEKVAAIRQARTHAPVGVVGDGINDAPALAEADVGISFGGASDLAVRAGDVILITNRLASLPEADRIARQTFRVIKQNLFWAFFYNVLAIPIAAAGYLHPMVAAAAMAFSDVIVVGNSLWLKYRKVA